MLALATLALRYPRVAKFLKRFGKWIAIAAVIAGAVVAFNVWKGNLEDAAEKRGFAAAEAQYKVKLDAANRIAANDDKQMGLMVATFGGLAAQRTQEINLKVTPILEGIKHEVASDPRYSACRVSDGVFDGIQAVRATVDAGIAASNPKGD